MIRTILKSSEYRRRFKQGAKAVLCVMLVFLLTSCSALISINESGYDSIPSELPTPDVETPLAPVGDVTEGEIYRANIYSISSDGLTLAPSIRVMWLTGADSLSERLSEEALRTPTLPGGAPIAPANSALAYVEDGNGIATISIRPGEHMSEGKSQAFLASAMASTLLEIEEISGVNVLVSGRAMEYMSLPIGTVTRENASLEKMIQDASDDFSHVSSGSQTEWRLVRNVTLYYPSPDGKYVVPEIKRLQFDTSDYASSIVRALSSRGDDEFLLPGVPLASDALTEKCRYVQENGENILEIRFSGDIVNAIDESAVERWQFLASVVLSTTTFCPNTDGVRVFVGKSMVTSVPDKGGEYMSFANGVIRRNDFAGRIAVPVKVYFENIAGKLSYEVKAVPLSEADSVRTRLRLLMEGPDTYGFVRTVPEGILPSDILGTGVSGSIASVNLSSEAYRLAQELTKEEEKMFVYSIVNTLTEIDGINGVRIYIDGRETDTLAGNIWLRGVLLPNPGLSAD
ncbi:MAG: GerMN domain-containing protein [Clostridia bacterium]|nr:GerMN domain-containing protein [Clostridia bacterium]